MKKEKFGYICTLGAKIDENLLEHMYQNGMVSIRLNMSYKNKIIRQEVKNIIKKHPDIEIMLDTAGPEIRLITNQNIVFKKGDIITIGEELNVSLNNLNLLNIGDILSVKDGKYLFEVVKVNDKTVECKCLESGIIENNNKLYNKLLYAKLPFISKWDEEVIEFGASENVSSIALSFVRNAQNIIDVRNILKKYSKEKIKIVAKIENEQAISNIDEIIEVSDEIMVARGDLGTIMPRHKIARIQKEIIEKCNLKNKKVIVATGVLESMQKDNEPSVSEVNDLYYIISNGADYVMFSRETALSEDPVLVLRTANEIYEDC